VRFRYVGPQGPCFRLLGIVLIDRATGQQHAIPHYARCGSPWRYRSTLPDGSLVFLENSRPLRRAWLTSRVIPLPGQTAVEAVLLGGKLPDGSAFETYRTALVEERVSLKGGDLGPNAGARIERHEAGRVTVKTCADDDAFLVLGDAYYPGWRAHVDGQPARIYRTDSVLRGVFVAPGTHVVEFVFQPRSFVFGLAVTALSALGLLTIMLWRRRPWVMMGVSSHQAPSTKDRPGNQFPV
jgi:hypothetical protein